MSEYKLHPKYPWTSITIKIRITIESAIDAINRSNP